MSKHSNSIALLVCMYPCSQAFIFTPPWSAMQFIPMCGRSSLPFNPRWWCIPPASN